MPGEGLIGEFFHYINGRFDVHQRVCAITQFKPGLSGKIVPSYMAISFGAWAMQNTVKATVDSLRLPTFKTFEMLVPPSKDEQDTIVAVLSEMDAQLAVLKARRDKASELKKGMVQELLRKVWTTVKSVIAIKTGSRISVDDLDDDPGQPEYPLPGEHG